MKCLSCGNDFEAKRSTAKYCSVKCRKLAFQQNGNGNAKGITVLKGQTPGITTIMSDAELLAHWAAGNSTPYQQDLGWLAEQYRKPEKATPKNRVVR